MTGANPDKNQKIAQSGPNLPEQNIDLQLTLGGVYAENQVETPVVQSTSSSSIINEYIPSSNLPAWAAEQVANNETFRHAIGVINENNSSQTPDAFQGFFSALSGTSSASASNKQVVLTKIEENERQGIALERGKHLAADTNPIPVPVMITESKVERKSARPFEDESGSSSKKAKTYKHVMRQDNEQELMQKMPSVISAGGIPNGQKIEGFLYKYGPGQVLIVCLCHGHFLSPAEFVKHAGGSDIENPMKHIKILVPPT